MRLTKSERSELGRMLAGLRKTRGGGRPKKLSPCPKCGAEFGVREMAKHAPACEGQPAAAADNQAKPAKKKASKG